MQWLSTRRVIKSGFVNFWRNGVVSVASVFVSVVTLFIIGALIMFHAFLSSTLIDIQNKVDVNVYFKTTAPENDILSLREKIESLPQVRLVEYISREEALAQFKERNKDNALILQSLEELGENPLCAVFNIKASSPDQYESIARFLAAEEDQAASSGHESIIDSVNYKKNELIITRLGRIIDAATKISLSVSLVLSIMAVLVTFNTLRLAIYNARNEIYVMRLVGASNSYIRGPFVVEGMIYGAFAAIIATILLYPTTIWVSRTTAGYFGGVDLLSYFMNNFAQLFILLFGAGIVLGVISSMFAVRRYLE